MSTTVQWKRFQQHLCRVPALEMTLDVSRMRFEDGFLERMAAPMQLAFESMDALEGGAIANPDEKRMVGHYWLRAPDLAPSPSIAAEIRSTIEDIKPFARAVHEGFIRTSEASRFTRSALHRHWRLGPRTDVRGRRSWQSGKRPDASPFHRQHGSRWNCPHACGAGGTADETLCIVTSKSGGTPEPRNAMMIVDQAFRTEKLDFSKHAAAITMPGSQLDQTAKSQHWLARFPMFDWIGGRTSVMSAVGLLPAALQGLDIDNLLAGAAACDAATRGHDIRGNPAALMALMWYNATGGKGKKDMVVLPYKDRLLLFSRYLQQLVMESLGKRLNLKGERVEQGIAVYGNKGTTDQHAYVQQLRDGVNNFFVTFIRVLESGGSAQE